MARVTVEDCVEKVPNRFDLVILAAQRAREVSAGASLTIERDNDKNPVVALREIADATVDQSKLEASLIAGLQKHVEVDEPEEEELTDMSAMSIELEGKGVLPEEEGEIEAEDGEAEDGEAEDGEAEDSGQEEEEA